MCLTKMMSHDVSIKCLLFKFSLIARLRRGALALSTFEVGMSPAVTGGAV